MGKFTNGQWHYSHAKGQGKKYVMCDGLRIATVALNSGRTDAKANAHLIAVAPDMYHELQADVDRINGQLAIFDGITNEPLIAERDRKVALLAKARGE